MTRRHWLQLVKYAALLTAVAFSMAVLDVPVSHWVHEHGQPSRLALGYKIIRLPGYVGFTIAVAVLLAWRRRCTWQAAALIVLNAVLASGVAAVVKVVAGRLRPFKGREPFDWAPLSSMWWDDTAARNLSFPSGDATLAFATAAMIGVIDPRWRWPAWVWAVAVAAVRVLQGAHYPSDVTAAAVVAVATTDLSLLIVRHVRSASQQCLPGHSPVRTGT